MLRIGDPIVESLASFEDIPRHADPAHEPARECTLELARCVGQFQDRFAAHTDIGRVNFAVISRTSYAVMNHLQQHPKVAALVPRTRTANGYLAEHAGNVFYLSILLGAAVRDYVIQERVRQT